MKLWMKIALAVSLVFCVWYIRHDYLIDELESTVQVQPVEGISLYAEADRRHLKLMVDGQNENAIVFDMTNAHFEILREGKWHKLFPKVDKAAWPHEVANRNEVTTFDYKMKDLVGRPLRPGTYRLVLDYEGSGFSCFYRDFAVFTVQ